MIEIEIQGIPVGGLGACLECIGVYKLHMDNAENIANEVPPPPINFAVTTAPSWQVHQQMGQTFMACVALPACMEHLGIKPVTPQQRAAQSGLIVPG